MEIGSRGTKLSFSSRNPTMKSNTRHACFDTYWGRTNPMEFHKKDIYFTFDYLHAQTEQFVEALNKMLSYMKIEFMDKEEVPVYIYEDSYGKRVTTTKPTTKKYETKTVLKGKYKVVFEDFFLNKIKEKNQRYGSVAQHLVYLCHHILCSLAVSENWLTFDEKFGRITYSKYNAKDLFDFVAYLSNNRNTGSNKNPNSSVSIPIVLPAIPKEPPFLPPNMIANMLPRIGRKPIIDGPIMAKMRRSPKRQLRE